MIQLLQKRRQSDEKGFTLIELMVVVLIIAILIAIAVPAFLGARKRAQDRAAQSNVKTVLTTEETYYSDAQEYIAEGPTLDFAELEAEEPSLAWTATPASAKGNTVYVAIAAGQPPVGVVGGNTDAAQRVYVMAKSGSGKCWWAVSDKNSGTNYSTSNACDAQPADGTFTRETFQK